MSTGLMGFWWNSITFVILGPSSVIIRYTRKSCVRNGDRIVTTLPIRCALRFHAARISYYYYFSRLLLVHVQNTVREQNVDRILNCYRRVKIYKICNDIRDPTARWFIKSMSVSRTSVRYSELYDYINV